jgi:acyl carrier protein
MTKHEFLEGFSETLQHPKADLTGSEALRDIPEWDSLAVVSLMAWVDEKCGVTISPDAIRKAASVNDLFEAVEAITAIGR